MPKISLRVARAGVITPWYAPGAQVGDVVVVDEAAARDLLHNGICTWHDGQKAAAPVLHKDIPPPAPELAPTAAPLLVRKPGYPVDRFSEVTRAWEGATVLLVAGGPSVTQELVDAARGRCRMVTVNNAYQLAPWADVMYFADASWWDLHHKDPRYAAFEGQKCTVEDTGMRIKDKHVHMLHNYGTGGLSTRNDGVHTAGNGGFQVLNMVLHSRPKKVLLLGYDMHFPGGKSHWHGDHPLPTGEDKYRKYAMHFNAVPAQLVSFGSPQVVNCSPGSIIRAFPFENLLVALPPQGGILHGQQA